ncbi:hypothetical protein SNEBB_001515, partial [Seison nebaliae]
DDNLICAIELLISTKIPFNSSLIGGRNIFYTVNSSIELLNMTARLSELDSQEWSGLMFFVISTINFAIMALFAFLWWFSRRDRDQYDNLTEMWSVRSTELFAYEVQPIFLYSTQPEEH